MLSVGGDDGGGGGVGGYAVQILQVILINLPNDSTQFHCSPRLPPYFCTPAAPFHLLYVVCVALFVSCFPLLLPLAALLLLFSFSSDQ